MAGSELLIGLLAGAGAASVFWGWYCRQLREEFERERERRARIARRSRAPTGSAGQIAVPTPESTPPAAGSRRLTVLVVEPEAETRRQLVARLADRGHRVVPTGDAEQALEMARRLRFDLVLAAAGVPGLDWLRVWEQFRRLAATVALLAAEEGPSGTPSGLEVGVPVLRKPVEPGELDRLLSRVASPENGAVVRA